ncbi:hypothetical protein CYLTODRAFT_92730 [Cylindrobasidium torrendii FP15055 ss-10]|uniref:Secreted protein n=1 Tax=Cylindrobasidium torrendii FP15055 ss-10 TaxID=1314674 RepID=A0A0D7BV75_9AGAR|nr:hypothetical protein CYLTODRAFT_92730 [Cylindrobasidium torrendii FP15055 ss-10]
MLWIGLVMANMLGCRSCYIACFLPLRGISQLSHRRCWSPASLYLSWKNPDARLTEHNLAILRKQRHALTGSNRSQMHTQRVRRKFWRSTMSS